MSHRLAGPYGNLSLGRVGGGQNIAQHGGRSRQRRKNLSENGPE
jgi:hypothetical protein